MSRLLVKYWTAVMLLDEPSPQSKKQKQIYQHPDTHQYHTAPTQFPILILVAFSAALNLQAQ